MVANWLYGVAHKTALKAQATATTRNRRERQVAEIPEPEQRPQPQRQELSTCLDDELSRLPDKYRAVIVLCDLEGKTRNEVARQLNVPEGTVAGWLARARTNLAKRLAQRGLTLTSGGLAVLLSQNAASAGLRASVLKCTVKAAALFAAGQTVTAGIISLKVVA